MSNTDAPFAAHALAEYGACQHVGLVLEQHDLCGLTAGCVGDIIFSKRGSYHDE